MNLKNTTSRTSTVLTAVGFAAFATIQFLTVLSAHTGFQEVVATNNNSAAVPSDANAPTMPTPSASNISNTSSADVPSDANAPTMPTP
jgi:hypothetical protein